MTRKKRMCKRLWSMLIIVALLMANVCGDFRTLRVEAEIANPNINYVSNSAYASVHDPVILQENGTYYMYSTGIIGHGAELRTSTDMVSWNYVSSFATQHDDELKTSEVMAATGNGMTNIWAPDVVKVGDEYWMFYSCSASGSRNSCIALAKASNPQGPFTYDGIVIQTSNSTVSNMNAIDACIEYDQEGRMWMAYGSFFGGIRVVELDKTTGYRKSPTDEGTLIASRPTSIDNGSLEGPIIRYHDGYYYLFVSYDNLFGVERGGGGSYHVRVGRSTTINGTYVDQDGVSMIQAAETTGYKLTANYKFDNATGWWAVGHCDIFEDTNGKWQYVSHARVNGDQNAPYSYIHQLTWNEDGWPIISPEPYVGETIKSMTVADAAGKYERIAFHDNKETLANTLTSVEMNLNSDYSATIEGVAGTGTWNFTGDNTVTVTIGNLKEVYTLMEGWDAENNRSTMVLTGNDMSGTNTGLQRWGKRIEAYDAPGYTVTVNANNNSYGTVSGGQTVNAGESVTVTANASVGYDFVHWVDENDTVVSTNATYTYQPTGNDDLTAMFSNESRPVITVATNNSEYGTVSGGNTVNVGEQITIVATPKGLGRFVSWKNSKGQIISKEETFTTRVYESDTITAYFEAISDYYVADYMTDGTSFSDALDTTGQTKAYLDGEAEVTNETVVVKGTAGDATPKDYVRMVNPFKNSEENAVSLVAYMSIDEDEEYDYKTLYTFYTDVGFLTITANGGIHFNDWSGNYFDDAAQTWTPDGEQHLYSLVVTENSISVYEDSTLINKYNCASNVLSFIKSCEYVSLGTGNDTYTDENGGWAWGNANTATSELLFVETEIGEDELGSMIYGGEPCTVSAITDGNGIVTSPQEDVNAGKTATVTAMANIGYRFAYWTDEQGNKVSTNAIYTFKVTRDITLQANFLPESSFVDISVNTEDAVKGTVTGSINDVIIGTDVTIKATPTTYYKFVGWRLNGEIVSTDAIYTFEAKADASYTAVFELDTDKISTTTFLPQSDDRLLAYYPFNDSLTNVKTSQNAGTVSAGGTGVASAANYNKYENYTVNGVTKTSVNLQVGTYGYELAKNANVPNNTEDYTISFWMKTNNVNMANASVMHLCNSETGDKLSIAMNSTAFNNNCIQTISKVDGATTNKASTVVANSGTWMNIILTVDSGTGTLYINGNKSITDISVGDIFTSSNYAMYTGVTDDAMVQYFYTALDEVYLYNGALSESEIAILANSGNYNNGDFVTARITISSNIQSAGTLYGAGDVIIGNEATVIARPNAGYRFINWTTQAGIVLADTEVYNFSPSGDITLVAVFEEEGGGEPEATPTPTPVVTATPVPVVTATPVPVVTATPEPVVTATPEPVVTATPEPVVTATPTPVVTATPEPVVTATPEPVVTATPEPVVTATPEPVVTATPEPVVTATPEPVVTATPEPVVTATPEPTPTATPEATPTPGALFIPSTDNRLMAYYPFDHSLVNVKTDKKATTVAIGGTEIQSVANYNAHEKYVVNGTTKTAVNLQVGTYGYEIGKNANVPVGTKQYTISFWMNTYNVNPMNSAVLHLVNLDSKDSLSVAMNSSAYNNNCIQTISDVDGNVTNKTSSVLANTGKWMNVILSVDKDMGTLYINGKKMIENISVGDIFKNSNYAIYTGVTDDSAVQYFYTSLDEVYIYEGVLSQKEIDVLSNDGQYNNGEFTLTVTTKPNDAAGGTVSGTGDIELGKKVTVIAKPNPGYVFKHWVDQNGKIVSTNATYTFIASEDITIEAIFEKKKVDSVSPTPNKQTLTAEQQQLLLVTVNEKTVEELIQGTNTDKGDPKGSLFAKLQLKATGKKKSVKLSWKKVKNADGYIIYGSACGSKMKKLKTITKGTVNKWTNKKLKKGKFYKYIIVAYYNVAGEKRIAYTSKSVHAITSGGKYGNPKKVNAKKSLKLKKDKKKKISAKLICNKKTKTHISKFRYESSNAKIVTVNKNGKIKALKKGKCYIYVYAQNGFFKKIKITVK